MVPSAVIRQFGQSVHHLILRTASRSTLSNPLLFTPSRRSQTRNIFSLIKKVMGNRDEDKMDKERKAQAADTLRTAMAALSGDLSHSDLCSQLM